MEGAELITPSHICGLAGHTCRCPNCKIAVTAISNRRKIASALTSQSKIAAGSPLNLLKSSVDIAAEKISAVSNRWRVGFGIAGDLGVWSRGCKGDSRRRTMAGVGDCGQLGTSTPSPYLRAPIWTFLMLAAWRTSPPHNAAVYDRSQWQQLRLPVPVMSAQLLTVSYPRV